MARKNDEPRKSSRGRKGLAVARLSVWVHVCDQTGDVQGARRALAEEKVGKAHEALTRRVKKALKDAGVTATVSAYNNV